MQTYFRGEIASLIHATSREIQFWAETGTLGPYEPIPPNKKHRRNYTEAHLYRAATIKELRVRGVPLAIIKKHPEVLRSHDDSAEVLLVLTSAKSHHSRVYEFVWCETSTAALKRLTEHGGGGFLVPQREIERRASGFQTT